MKRKKIGLAVALIGAVLIVISCCSVKAEAADNVILSMEQTLALYGSSFDVTYYNPDRDYVVNVPAEYIGNSLALVPNSHFDDIYFYGHGNMNDQAYSQFIKMPCLIYAIYNLDGRFVSYNGNAHFNITKKFPVNLDNITKMQQNIFWSGYYGTNGDTAGNYYYSDVLCNTSFNGQMNTPATGNNAFHVWERAYGYCIFPTYKIRDTINDTLDESRTAYLYGVQLNFTAPHSGDVFSVSEQTFRLNGVGTLDVFNRRDFTNPSSDEVLRWPALADAYADVVLLLISCPILTGYEPPVTTAPPVTAPPAGTVSAVTANTNVTVDLSNLESGVAAIVAQQREELNLLEPIYINGYNQVNQLNTIIQQLDAIYNRMLQSGEISVDLAAGLAMPRNETIETYINERLGSYTMASLPSSDLTQGISFISYVMQLFGDNFTWFFTLGAFSLSLGVAFWVIFRGKGGS